VTRDPFAALGLAASRDLTDDDVRAAWRRVAAATHPDRADGGDPAQFAAAASAYSDLRTRFGRNEALADLRTTARRPRSAGRWAPRARPGSGPVRPGRRVPGAGRAGRVGCGAGRTGHGDPGARWAGRVGCGAGRTGHGDPGARWAGHGDPGARWAGRGVPGVSWAGHGVPGAGWAGRVRRGRPGRLALRVTAVAAASVLVVVIAGWQPATLALMVGALTWLIRTARQDLAPRPGPGRPPARRTRPTA
jgi:hypothetical protein